MEYYMSRSGRSSLDLVLDDALRLQKSVTSTDRDKLDEYLIPARRKADGTADFSNQ